MSTALDEITFQRLQEFRRRRLVLTRSRNWSAVITVFIATLFLAVLVDTLSTNDQLRFAASATVYVATLASWFWLCWLPQKRAEPLQVEAQRFEDADPRLREHLLTAVEFANNDSEQSLDSFAFKDQLQSHVASLIAPVDVKQLLPWSMVRRALYVAATALALLVLLAFVPRLHWMNRVARALLPAANLDRVAAVAIILEEPQPNSKVIAAGDMVGVIARIEGRNTPREPGKVILESRSTSGELMLVPMQEQIDAPVTDTPVANPTGDSENSPSVRYHATLSTDELWIEYRVTASGAATRWHRLTTQPRPDIDRFEVRITPPAYAGLEPIPQATQDGNIQAIMGSHIELRIALNQPVAVAEMRWQSDAGSSPIRFTRDANSELYVAEFNVDRSDSYRIHLQSAVTGFINEFSPSYSVDAIVDQPPQVAWTKPANSKQVVVPDQILSLAAQTQDEFQIASLKQLMRVGRDAEWIATNLDLTQTKSVATTNSQPDSLAGSRNRSDVAWQVDLLKTSTRVGDIVEMKLVAEDRKGQSTDSEVVEFLVSQSSITSVPTPAEILRQDIAAALDSFAQQTKQQRSAIDELAKSKERSQNALNEAERAELSDRLTEAASALSETITADVPKLLNLIEHAASQTEGSARLLELEQVGLALAMLRTKNAGELATVTKRLNETDAELGKKQLTSKQRGELEKEIVQQAKRIEQVGETVSSGFRAIASHDVGRRVAWQASQLEQLFTSFSNSLDNTAPQAIEQAKRQSVVLTRQLMELQQSMLDSLPVLRQETQQRVRQSADSISQLVTQFEATKSQGDLAALKSRAEQIENSLSQMKNAGSFDGGLHEAVMSGHRRFAEFGGQPVDQLRRALANLVADKENVSTEIRSASFESAVENITERRTLSRSRLEGDREFASDLGTAVRALRAIMQNTSLSKSDQHREANETATALETLQAVHGVNETAKLLEELLRGERWSLSSSDARVHHPILFDSFAERLENAVKLLRQAKVPNEIVSRIERLRWEDATNKAGQKINSRRWENTPAVSTATELSQISEQLADAKAELEPLAAEARAALAKQAPSLEELASKAAEATRKLQQRTSAIADAIERDEAANESQQIAQLKSEQMETQLPITELREALVDQADAQNLLDSKELMTARESDAALAVVDSAQQDINDSMQTVSAPNDQQTKASALQTAAEQQASATAKLEELAALLQQATQQATQSETKPDATPQQSGASEELMRLAQELGENTDSQKRFSEAEQLARLSAARPEEVLRQLENKLANNVPMQQEMSRIAQELAEQALKHLDRAADQQQRMQPALEASDPQFQSQKNLLLKDVQAARENANQMLGLLVSEAKWTAGAGKEEASQKGLEATEKQLRSELAATEKVNLDDTFEELRGAATTLSKSLAAAQADLSKVSQSLEDASAEKVHQNDADLANRRREMRERQRRVAQQDVRNMQQIERNQQQHVRQAENEVKQAAQREKSLEQHSKNLQKEVEKHPQNESLKQQLTDAERNLALGVAQKKAAEQLKIELERRAATAAKRREAAQNREQTELNSVNPSAEVSAELAQTAAQRSAELSENLNDWVDAASNALLPEATAAQLQNSLAEQRSVSQSVKNSVDDLSRAARHEGRLNNQPAQQLLAEQSAATENLNSSEVSNAERSLSSALENSKRANSATGQADTASTQAALSQTKSSDLAIRSRADQLRSMLGELSKAASAQQSQQQSQQQTASEANTGATSQLLDAQQLAQLLDEVDRQLNSSQQESNAANASSQQKAAGKQTPSTISAAAEKIASQLSQNRDPAPQADPSQSMATESSSANVDPQGAVVVKVVDVNRIGADWGKLRERVAEDMIESKRETVSSTYRQQIEAYFRSLAERGQATDAQ